MNPLRTQKNPLWREEVSIFAADERYVNRRQFAKFLVLTSAGMFVGNAWILLRSWLAGQEHVQQAFYVTGEADFILVVTAPDTETYDALMARLTVENPNVRKFTTNVALGVVKRGLTIPVGLEEE